MSLPDVKAEKIPNYYSGDTDEFTDEFLQGKLDEVVDKIADRYGTAVAARLASGRLTERLYEATVVRIASRVFENPEGFKKENEGGYGYEVNAAVGSGTLWFTDDDVLDLTGVHPDPKKRPAAIGTISVGLHRPGRAW